MKKDRVCPYCGAIMDPYDNDGCQDCMNKKEAEEREERNRWECRVCGHNEYSEMNVSELYSCDHCSTVFEFCVRFNANL